MCNRYIYDISCIQGMLKPGYNVVYCGAKNKDNNIVYSFNIEMNGAILFQFKLVDDIKLIIYHPLYEDNYVNVIDSNILAAFKTLIGKEKLFLLN